MIQEDKTAIQPELGPNLEGKRDWRLGEHHAAATIPAGNAQNRLITGRILFG
jgi:hypothetical protein